MFALNLCSFKLKVVVCFGVLFVATIGTRPNWPRKVREMKWTVWYALKQDQGQTGQKCKSLGTLGLGRDEWVGSSRVADFPAVFF